MKVLGWLILVLVTAAGSYFLLSQNKSSLPPEVITGIPSPTQIMTTPQPTITNNDFQAGESSYLDPQGVYVFLYPSAYKLDEQNSGKQIRIYKKGATQKGQTEMYDGVIV